MPLNMGFAAMPAKAPPMAVKRLSSSSGTGNLRAVVLQVSVLMVSPMAIVYSWQS